MSRIQGILAAGTLTVVVLAAVLAFGGFDFARAGGDDGAGAAPAVQQPTGSGDDDAARLEEANQTIDELQASLAVMQQREAQYNAQIEAANQAILQLQGADSQLSQPAPTQQAASAPLFFGGDDDRDDWDDDDDRWDDDHDDDDDWDDDHDDDWDDNWDDDHDDDDDWDDDDD